MPHLTPRAKEVLDYLQVKSPASSRDALMDIDMNSGSFTRRITELRDAGYKISDTSHKHPMSGRRYKRYSLHI